MDFEVRERGRVKEYLRKKYGHVANLSTFGYFKNKGVIKDAAKVWGITHKESQAIVDKVSDFEDFETSRVPEVQAFRNRYPEVLELARGLRGRIRQAGIHAAGMVVSKEPIEHFVPIETREDEDDKVSGRVPVAGIDMGTAEEVGLIKLDVLGLNNLDIIDDTIKMVKERQGIDVILPTRKADFNDPAVFKMLSDGHTVGIFQAEQAASTSLLKEMRIQSFDDLAASNALVRPGAKNTVGAAFIKRQDGREQVRYAHEVMEPFLSNSYGVIIYQEQVMQTAVALGGMSMAEANKLRRIIGKKKDPKEFAQYREAFITGASRLVPKAVAEALFHDFEAHAGYSFNYTHAACYSALTYWDAMLKLYYPLEFIYASLKNVKKEKRTSLLIEAKRLGLKMLLPHVNKSDADFTLEGDAIRFGLTSIKYVGDMPAEAIIKHRPFQNYKQLLDLALEKGSGISTRAVGSMNKIGAAAFADNPRTGEEENNLYEFLGVPKFDADVPADVEDKITPLADYTEDGCFVIRAVVEKVFRKDSWARAELVDETGSAGIFVDTNADLEKGQLYFFLVGGNGIVEYARADEVSEGSAWTGSGFVRYLHSKDLGLIAGGPKYVVGFQRRMTKQKKLMGTIVLANEKGELRSALVFPKEFPRIYTKVKPGEVYDLEMARTQDGTLFVKGIVG
jgi:DNA-directed DNA polymerase III PolC